MNLFRSKESPGYLGRLKQALQVNSGKELTQKIDRLLGPGESPITEEQFEEMEHVLICRRHRSTDGSGSHREVQREDTRQPIGYGSGHQEPGHGRAPDSLLGGSCLGGKLFVPATSCNLRGRGQWGGQDHYHRQAGPPLQAAGEGGPHLRLGHFRAAAIRAADHLVQADPIRIVMQKPGADPAAVLFDAMGRPARPGARMS